LWLSLGALVAAQALPVHDGETSHMPMLGPMASTQASLPLTSLADAARVQTGASTQPVDAFLGPFAPEGRAERQPLGRFDPAHAFFAGHGGWALERAFDAWPTALSPWLRRLGEAGTVLALAALPVAALWLRSVRRRQAALAKQNAAPGPSRVRPGRPHGPRLRRRRAKNLARRMRSLDTAPAPLALSFDE
jgi:hypothetical protein